MGGLLVIGAMPWEGNIGLNVGFYKSLSLTPELFSGFLFDNVIFFHLTYSHHVFHNEVLIRVELMSVLRL
jgi:hypothetical protein